MAPPGCHCSPNMLEIAMELAAQDASFEDMALKFAEHFLWIAHSMNQMGPDGMWDERMGSTTMFCGFPDGRATRLKVRSMVGLLPSAPPPSSSPGSASGYPVSRPFCVNAWSACPGCGRACTLAGPGISGTPSAVLPPW